MTLRERFEAKVERRGEDECWAFQGYTMPSGHGQMALGRRQDRRERAHRVSYELYVGPIPDGCIVHHTCESPSCCNPAHLQLTTRREHPSLHKKAKCPHGHPYSGENLGVTKRGVRYCKSCKRGWDKARYAKRRSSGV